MFLDEATFSGYSYNRCLTGCALERSLTSKCEASPYLRSRPCSPWHACGHSPPTTRTINSRELPAPSPATSPVNVRFHDTVRPFLESYCLGCHGKEKPKGDLDLSAYTTADSVAKDLPQWEMVLEQLKGGTMPPAKAKKHPERRGAPGDRRLDPGDPQARGQAELR